MHDHEADDEETYADEDLEAAFLRLEADLPRRGEKKHERECVEAVHEPVRLRLRQGEEKCECAHCRQNRRGWRDDRHGYRGGYPDRRPDCLPPDPVPLP